MGKKINFSYFLYIFYLIVNVIISVKPNFSGIGQLSIFLVNLIAFFLNKNLRTQILLSSFIMGNEMLSILNCVIVLLLGMNKMKIDLKKINKKTFLFISIVVANAIISACQHNTFLNVLFSGIYILLLLYVFYKCKDNIDGDDFLYTTKKFIILEFIVTIILLLKSRMFIPNDLNFGTFFNAHNFGNWIIANFIILINYLKNKKQRFINYMYILILIVMLYFTDSKALVLSLLLYLILSPLFSFISKKKNGIALGIIGTYISIVIVMMGINTDFVRNKVYKYFPDTYPYLYVDGWNYKVKYIDGVLFKEMMNHHLFIGYGIGQFGSRFANLFAYDVMYRNDSSLNNFVIENFNPHHNSRYIKYVSFYTPTFVNTIKYKSAILTYPFSSLITILAELGIIGLLFLAFYLSKQFLNSKFKNLIFYFVIICLFDNYIDMFVVCGYLLICLSINKDFVIKSNVVTEIEGARL